MHSIMIDTFPYSAHEQAINQSTDTEAKLLQNQWDGVTARRLSPLPPDPRMMSAISQLWRLLRSPTTCTSTSVFLNEWLTPPLSHGDIEEVYSMVHGWGGNGQQINPEMILCNLKIFSSLL